MEYSKFLNLSTEANDAVNWLGKYAVKTDYLSDAVKERILQNVELPDFYAHVSKLQGVRMYQGNYFIDKPHYEKNE